MAKRIITTDILEEDVSSEKNSATADIRTVYWTGKSKRNLKVYIEAAKQRGRYAGSCRFLWTSGTWKDDACRYHCQ